MDNTIEFEKPELVEINVLSVVKGGGSVCNDGMAEEVENECENGADED